MSKTAAFQLVSSALTLALALTACSSDPQDTSPSDELPLRDAATELPSQDAAVETSPEADAAPEAAPQRPLVVLAVDGNHDGIVTPTDATETDDGIKGHGTGIFLPNLDDDDGDGRRDFANDHVDGPKDWKDLAPLVIAPVLNLPEGAHGQLSVDAVENVRLFRSDDGNDATALELPVTNLTKDDLSEGVTYGVEARYPVISAAKEAWSGTARWTLRVVAQDGTLIGESKANLRVAPLIFPSSIQPAKQVWSSDIDSWFVLAMKAALKKSSVPYTPLHILDKDGYVNLDVWTQDMFELGTMSMPSADAPDKRHTIRVALRTPTPDRDAADRVIRKLVGEDFGWVHLQNNHYNWNTPSVDSMGNWDTVPPYSTSKASYPLGRFLIGSTPQRHPDTKAMGFIEAQGAQPLLRVDTSWLAVGHVDEIISFVPRHMGANQSWQLLFARPALAIDMLKKTQQQGHGEALMHEGKSWEDGPATISVDDVLSNTSLMASNQEDQVVLDDILDGLQEELELPSDRVTYVPFLEYEYEDWGSVAYQPGTVNMLVVGDHLIVPKPFGPKVSGKDIFEQYLEANLGAIGLTVHFVDDWDTYHAYMGEIHCATNVDRAMRKTPWWTVQQ